MRVLFGGNFDPVHHGHVAVARHLRDAGAEVCMLMSINPPHRNAPLASREDRMAMLRLAFNGEAGIRVLCTDEICQSPYTIDLLRQVRTRIGAGAPLAWAMGFDQYAHLNSWREWRQLVTLAHLVVFTRPAADMQVHHEVHTELQRRHCEFAQLFSESCGRVTQVANAPPDVSSSEIRTCLKRRGEVSAMLPEPVLRYVQSRHLYQENQEASAELSA